jgi:hypothetical protein
VNSGNWTLNSAVSGGAAIVVNTAVAVPAVSTWHKLTITLVNGVYTFTLDGTGLGTVTDSNLLTTTTAVASAGGAISIQPSSFTSATFAFMDSSDVYITGLSR